MNQSKEITDLLDTTLDTILTENTHQYNSTGVLDTIPPPSKNIPLVHLPEGELDPRLKLLSHSSRTTLHSCPRKYQLYRQSSNQLSLAAEKEVEQGVTFAYGTAVGVGVASILEKKSEDQVLIDTFLSWDVDLLDENPRQKKSFWLALFAVQKMLALRNGGFLEDYELVYWEGRPATELSFQVLLPEGFRYRGFVDAVLQHRTTKEVMVLECKTASSNAQPATYKNSGQAVGYSVVLDVMFPDLSSYSVLYLVYETKNYEYKQLPFQKSLLQRALWLQELLIDTEQITLYHSYNTFPMHGESCYAWFRDCEYLSLCTLSTERLIKPLNEQMVEDIAKDEAEYEFTVDFYDLVERQIEKGES